MSITDYMLYIILLHYINQALLYIYDAMYCADLQLHVQLEFDIFEVNTAGICTVQYLALRILSTLYSTSCP